VPRSNRSRRRRGAADEPEPLDVSRIAAGMKRTETKRSGTWLVQSAGAASAHKSYICPGCAGSVAPGTAHVVTWRADHVLGDDAALAERRHWHKRCWRIEP
jgi:hypothetical protein